MTALYLAPADILAGDTVLIPTGHTDGPDDTIVRTFDSVVVTDIRLPSRDFPMTTAVKVGAAWMPLPNDAVYQVERP